MSDVATLTNDGSGLHIRVPMSLKRRGGRKEVVLSEGLPRRLRSTHRAHSALVLAVVRGHRWKELLESGRYPSIDALAAQMGVNASYVGRHLNLALLAPHIVAATPETRPTTILPSRLPTAVLVVGAPIGALSVRQASACTCAGRRRDAR